MREVVSIASKYKTDKVSTEEVRFLAYTDLFYLATCILGLLTFQWYLFIGILFLSLIPKRKRIWLYQIDSTLCLLALLFAIINNYHFHLNLF